MELPEKAPAALTRASSDSVFGFDSRIRCCMVFGLNGRPLLITHRRKHTSLEPDEDVAFIRGEVALYTNGSKFANRYHGGVRAFMLMREKRTLIAYPFRENLVIVTADPDFPLDKTNGLGKLLKRLHYWSAEPWPPSCERLPPENRSSSKRACLELQTDTGMSSPRNDESGIETQDDDEWP